MSRLYKLKAKITAHKNSIPMDIVALDGGMS